MRICCFFRKRPPRTQRIHVSFGGGTPSDRAVNANLSSTGLSGTVEVPYDRTWRQKWRDIATGVDKLQNIYVGNVIDRYALGQQVKGLFADLHEIADHLDHQEFGHKKYARTRLYNYPDLEICAGFVNTKKHDEIDRGKDPITAWMQPARGNNGVSMDIKWSRPSGLQGTEDALDLAKRCVRDWGQFFAAHKLTP
jgi:hypothetical protein